MTVGELRNFLDPYADHVLVGVQDIGTGGTADITGVRPLVDLQIPDPLLGSKTAKVLLITVHVWRIAEKS